MLTTEPGGGLVVRRVRVRVTSGPDRGREALLEAGTLLVGTHGDNDLILRDASVDEYHLEIALVAGGVRVRDQGTSGGTFIHHARVGAQVVPVGTEVMVGRSTLQLLAADMAVPVTPSERCSFGPVLGRAASMRQLFALLERVAPTEVPVLLEGEPGTGRTLIAKAIHASSRFAMAPTTVVDLSAPSSERQGLAHLAQRADTFTLVLERIDHATNADLKPLLAIYDRREEGVLDARILATSATDLRPAAQGAPELHRRLLAHVTAVRLVIPPLRDRLEDLDLLVSQFARECCGVEPALEPGDLARAAAREYPGNVRELRQLVTEALKVKASAPVLPSAGPERARAALVMPLNARPKPPTPALARERLRDFFERDWLRGLHAKLHGDLDALGRETGLERRALLERLRDLGLAVGA